MNYSVAKITCDCAFSLTKIVKQKLKTRTITETQEREVYEDVVETKENTEIVFDETLNRYIQRTTTTEVTNQQVVKDTHDLYDEEGNILGTHQTTAWKVMMSPKLKLIMMLMATLSMKMTLMKTVINKWCIRLKQGSYNQMVHF